jgi:hypothetical protein
MKRRKLSLSESSHAKLLFYRGQCITCVWGGKSYTRPTSAHVESVAHHRKWPDHWVVVRESKPIHEYRPEPNYLPISVDGLDVPPF